MIDLIGALFDIVDGESVRLWGWHVNITSDLLEANPHLQSAVRTPAIMRRVWAGDDPASPSETVALRFNGESAAREALGVLWPDQA